MNWQNWTWQGALFWGLIGWYIEYIFRQFKKRDEAMIEELVRIRAALERRH